MQHGPNHHLRALLVLRLTHGWLLHLLSFALLRWYQLHLFHFPIGSIITWFITLLVIIDDVYIGNRMSQWICIILSFFYFPLTSFFIVFINDIKQSIGISCFNCIFFIFNIYLWMLLWSASSWLCQIGPRRVFSVLVCVWLYTGWIHTFLLKSIYPLTIVVLASFWIRDWIWSILLGPLGLFLFICYNTWLLLTSLHLISILVGLFFVVG